MPNFKVEDELTLSLQDYLETIGFLIKKNKIARVKDIAEVLNVKLASVTGALRQLKEKGYVEYSPYSFITLTKKGEELANSLMNAHIILKEMFKKVFLINEREAEKLSCVIEHYISDNSLEKIKKFLEFAKKKELAKEFMEFQLK